MDVLSSLGLGLQTALQPQNLMYAGAGALVGTIVGVLPGIGPLVAMAVLLPLTFKVPPTQALILLAGIYYGAMYGGSTTSILLNVPGESSSVMTAVDGYRLRLAGRAGPALSIAALASFTAGILGTLGLAVLAFPITSLALAFGPPEYFALTLLALSLVVTLSTGNLLKGFIVTALGLWLASIGPDIITGVPRFTFGRYELLGGIPFIDVVLGIFAIGEVAHSCAEKAPPPLKRWIGMREMLPTGSDLKSSSLPTLRSSVVGFVVGVLPGAGATIASFLAYAIEKRLAKDPSRFGRGAIEGVAAPEAANNAAAQGSLVPLLTLGIPGSGAAAVILGAFILYGLQPGPALFRDHPDIAWGLIASMLVGNLMLLVLNLPLVGVFVQILRLPFSVIGALTILLALTGAYVLNGSMWDVGVAVLFGFVGYAMRVFGYPAPPLVLAMVLGDLMERSFRQALLLTDDGVLIFVMRPISLVLLIALALSVIIPALRRGRAVAGIAAVPPAAASEEGA